MLAGNDFYTLGTQIYIHIYMYVCMYLFTFALRWMYSIILRYIYIKLNSLALTQDIRIWQVPSRIQGWWGPSDMRIGDIIFVYPQRIFHTSRQPHLSPTPYVPTYDMHSSLQHFYNYYVYNHLIFNA